MGPQHIAEAGKAWEAVRADPAIQYAPVAVPPEPPPEPGWLDAFFRWLAELLEPVGRSLGLNWPVFKWVLLAMGIAAAAFLVWRIAAPMLGWRLNSQPATDDELGWTPDSGAALALLEDADRLAAEGRYDEATHLLLQRSVGQIAAARPDLVEPATTARELAALPALPPAARAAFATIAARVERSLFALRALGADDWHTARGAYAEFALAPLAGPA
jgi:hypothetical protein